MSYNFFKDARSISNSFLCRHDSIDGYASDFSTNGDVDGWDLYDSIYLYGSWGGMLFGSSYERECYIGRSIPFNYISAETHYIIRVMMKITSTQSTKEGPTKGKIRWLRYGDTIWDDKKEYEFEVTADDRWRLYEINMGPAQWWQGDINNLRIYPFTDGWGGDKFAIKYIRVSSLNKWGCNNTQCSYYSSYKHICPGAGSRGYCQAGISKTLYNTVENVNDEFIVNINGYGNLSFGLGTNKNLSGNEMAHVINKHLSTFNNGGYAYSTVEYTPVDDKLKIFSGTVGNDSSVTVIDTPAARALGFYDEWGNNVSNSGIGTSPASGFDYASSRLLTYTEINRLLDDSVDSPAYNHTPSQFSVEAGRRDFFMVGEGLSDRAYKEFDNKGNTLIDLSHPFDNNGKITDIYIYGIILEGTTPNVKIIRPLKNGSLKVVHSVDLPSYDPAYMYTNTPVVYRVDCELLVQKGDYIGIYNMDVYVGQTFTGEPDATFFLCSGEVSGEFDPGEINSNGLGGFPIYARSNRRQTNTIIDIDMGERVNIEEVNFYGKEYNEIMEYNIASCLDVNWDVNLFGGTHTHYGTYPSTGLGWTETHQNIAVGVECLNDCIVTADNGKAGNGLQSLTGEHSYFYVTGDAEWGYKSVCDGTTEFCGNKILESTVDYFRDPVEFLLNFPYGFKTKVHKSVMYFKENHNFRNFSLSTRRGFYDSLGNSDKPGYDYVPQYSSVSVDGVEYVSEDSFVGPYLFKNPCNSDIKVKGNVVENEDESIAAIKTRWNVIAHEFSPIECAGFRIFCNKHYSTKITELEVYSSFTTTPALNDNIFMTYSTYGDNWVSANFVETNDSQIKAFIGGAPRYFRIDIDAQTKFRIDGMEAEVGDQVKVANCDNDIYLTDSKRGVTNESYKLDIPNVYEVPLDLNIDIPSDVYSSYDIVFWNKLGSNIQLAQSEIGPPALLHRRDDYELLGSTGQCAINTPCYGLKNMIHNKKAYYQINEASWVEYGTLSSGVSIDYSNYPNSKKTILSFAPVSSKFWKISTNNSAIKSSMFGVTAKNSGNIVPINKIYYSAPTGALGATYYSHLGLDNSISSSEVLDYTFGSDSFTSYFNMVSGYPSNNVVESIDGLYVNYLFANSYVELQHSLEGSAVSFDFECILERNDSWDDAYGFSFDFKDPINNSIIKYEIQYRYGWYGRVYSEGVYQTNQISGLSDHTYKIIIKRRSNNCTIQIYDLDTSSYVVNWSGNLSTKSIHKVCVGLVNYDITGNGHHFPPVTNNTTTLLKNVKVTVVPYFSVPESIIVELYSSLPLDEIVIFPENSILSGGLDLLISNVNGSFYDYSSGLLVSEENYYINFAVDLENRHDIEIIRNYGSAAGKLLLSKSNNTDFSNSFVNDPNNVVWENSSYNDVRWLRIPMLCGDGTSRYIRKLGVYPDISTSVCHNGGYNCEWHSLGTSLTNYPSPVNTVSGIMSYSNFVGYNYPTYTIDGHPDTYWSFYKESSDPFLDIDLGALESINKFVLLLGSANSNPVGFVTDYTISVSNTISGSNFVDVVDVSGNTDYNPTHFLSIPINVRRVRLTIGGFSSELVNVDGSPYNVGYIRDIQVWTASYNTYIDSETWPVVCVDLIDNFFLSGHSLINKDVSDELTDWDNDEDFFRYAVSPRSDPHKVAFYAGGSYQTVFSYAPSTGNLQGDWEYTFQNEVYLHKGLYVLTWRSYSADEVEEVSVRFEGNGYYVDAFAKNLSSSWVDQTNTISIQKSGYYSVKLIQHIDNTYYWGASNIVLKSSGGNYRWVAVTRDTAENYSYDDTSSKYGKDYLAKLQIYSSEKNRPTERFWWWESSVSSLSNDYIFTKKGERSLKIEYPASSAFDTVRFVEGDTFGKDTHWSIKDYLTFWLYIDDINNLDTGFGYINFGAANYKDPVYYTWYISNISLHSGWNEVKLRFEDADSVSIEEDYNKSTETFNSDMDFKNNSKDLESFSFTYRGVGSPITIYLDDLKISRSEFELVKYGNGVCLFDTDFLEIPITGVSMEKGSIEFWYKFYTDTSGYDIFNRSATRVLFSITNNNNDFIALTITEYSWFQVLVGNLRNVTTLTIDENARLSKHLFSIGDTAHIAIVWSNDGLYMDNGDTVRFYINNELVFSYNTVWEIGDTKSFFLKFGGAVSQINAFMNQYDGCGVVDNVKIYNYCKSNFNINKEAETYEKYISANKFLEISPDNINFYGQGDSNLPIVFEGVPVNENRSIYLRSIKDDSFNNSLKTANLLIEWTSIV